MATPRTPARIEQTRRPVVDLAGRGKSSAILAADAAATAAAGNPARAQTRRPPRPSAIRPVTSARSAHSSLLVDPLVAGAPLQRRGAPPPRGADPPHRELRRTKRRRPRRSLGRPRARRITDEGETFGVSFRPVMFHALLGTSMASITDRVVPLEYVLGTSARSWARAIDAARAPEEKVALTEALLLPLLTTPSPRLECVRDLVERIAVDRSVLRVDDIARASDLDARALQRCFRTYVGVSPKSVIQRYRLHEAVIQLRAPHPPSLAALGGFPRLRRSGPLRTRLQANRRPNPARRRPRARGVRRSRRRSKCSRRSDRSIIPPDPLVADLFVFPERYGRCDADRVMLSTRMATAAAVGAMALACGCSSHPTGVLGNGEFRYLCGDDSDTACTSGDTDTDLPSAAIAVGSAFQMAYRPNSSAGSIQGATGYEIVAASPRLATTSGDTVATLREGFVALLARHTGNSTIDDFVHLHFRSIHTLIASPPTVTLGAGGQEVDRPRGARRPRRHAGRPAPLPVGRSPEGAPGIALVGAPTGGAASITAAAQGGVSAGTVHVACGAASTVDIAVIVTRASARRTQSSPIEASQEALDGGPHG